MYSLESTPMTPFKQFASISQAHRVSINEHAQPSFLSANENEQPISARDIFAQAQIEDDLLRVEQLLLERTASRSAVITAASAHIVRAGGKRLRAALVLLAGKLADYSLDKVIHPAASAELIQAASLVHDDLVDQANQRRGHVTVHARWDNDVALMVGDYFFALAAGEMALSPDPRIITFYAQAVQTIVEGELNPVMVVEPFEVAFDQYLFKTGSKTASLFEAACKAGITATGGSPEDIEALGQFGFNLGIAFQIVDDMLDFTGDEQTLGKPAGNDLRQGTITLPLIHAVANGGPTLLRDIVHTSTPSDQEVHAAVDAVISYGGVHSAAAAAEEYVQRALTHIEHFPDTQARRALQQIAFFILHRVA